MLKDNNQTKKALEILEEQVAYFAKEKVATGLLAILVFNCRD